MHRNSVTAWRIYKLILGCKSYSLNFSTFNLLQEMGSCLLIKLGHNLVWLPNSLIPWVTKTWFLLTIQYHVMQRTDANEEKHQLGDYQLIQYQFLGPIIVRINDIVKHLSSFVGKHWELCSWVSQYWNYLLQGGDTPQPINMTCDPLRGNEVETALSSHPQGMAGCPFRTNWLLLVL